MSHVSRDRIMSQVNESRLTSTSHVSRKRVMSHVNESCHTSKICQFWETFQKFQPHSREIAFELVGLGPTIKYDELGGCEVTIIGAKTTPRRQYVYNIHINIWPIPFEVTFSKALLKVEAQSS